MKDNYTDPITINNSTYRRPYLNFKEKITQLLINPYSVVLFLFIIKLFFFLNSLINTLENARSQTTLLYSSLEDYASNIVSFPHYMAKVSNVMIAKSIESANNGLTKTLELMISASENIIYFVVELSIGTYECLLTAAIDDTAIAALNATEEVITVVNDTIISFATLLEDGLEDLSDAINDVVDTAEDTADALTHLFSNSNSSKKNLTQVHNKVSNINLTISNLKDWEISGNINSKIDKLKNEILNFTDVEYYTKQIIKAPFTELKRQVSDNLNETFSADDMYVPGMAELDFSLGTENINNLYIDLIKIAKTATHVIIGLIALSILILILYEYYIELRDWRRVISASQHLNFANESFIKNSDKKKYNIEVIRCMQDRKSNMIGDIITNKIFRLKNPIIINNIRWMISYCASPILLSFFLLGLLGIISVICQYIILTLITKVDFNGISSEIFENTKDDIYIAFNNSLNEWTNETNIYLQDYENDVNDNLFGWVDTAAMTINNTVTEFDKEMNDALDSIFGNTPLYTPIEQIVGCVIESKLKKIEKAMTWLEDNAKLVMPQMNPKSIMEEMIRIESSNSSSTLTDNIDKFKEKSKELLHDVIKFYKDENIKLLYISIGILIVWFLFFCLGLIMLFWKERKIRIKATINEKVAYDEKEVSSSTIKIPFDGSSLRSLSSDNSWLSVITFNNIAQNFLDKYIKAKERYVRTPTEPSNEDSNVKSIILDNSDISSNIEDAKTLGEDDGTLSVIGESDKSIAKALRWLP